MLIIQNAIYGNYANYYLKFIRHGLVYFKQKQTEWKNSFFHSKAILGFKGKQKFEFDPSNWFHWTPLTFSVSEKPGNLSNSILLTDFYFREIKKTSLDQKLFWL